MRRDLFADEQNGIVLTDAVLLQLLAQEGSLRGRADAAAVRPRL